MPICHYATNINEPHKLFNPDSDNLRHTIRDRLVGMGAVQNWGTDSYPSASNEAIAAHSMEGRGRPCACPLPSALQTAEGRDRPCACPLPSALQSADGRGRPCACPLLSNQRKVGAGLVPALCPPVSGRYVQALCLPSALQSTEGRGRPCACPLPCSPISGR